MDRETAETAIFEASEFIKESAAYLMAKGFLD